MVGNGGAVWVVCWGGLVSGACCCSAGTDAGAGTRLLLETKKKYIEPVITAKTTTVPTMIRILVMLN